MTSSNIYTILSSKPHNPHHLRRYYRFISSIQTETGYAEEHHILPESVFPEFKNLREHTWNSVLISARHHFIAHCMLARCFAQGSKPYYSMIKAFSMMKSSSHNQCRYINSRLYDYNRRHMSATMSFMQSGQRNSQYNTIWVTSRCLNHVKKVSKDLLNEYYEQGWFLSRSSSPIKTVKARKSKDTKKIKTSGISSKQIYIKMIHPLSYDFISVRMEIAFEYMLDGWVASTRAASGSGKIKITKDQKNLCIDPINEQYFFHYGWVRGLHNPNHKGTSGKTYKWMDGKKVFD